MYVQCHTAAEWTRLGGFIVFFLPSVKNNQRKQSLSQTYSECKEPMPIHFEVKICSCLPWFNWPVAVSRRTLMRSSFSKW